MKLLKNEDISEDAYERLAKVFYPHIVDFFADPKNQDDYEKAIEKSKSQLAV